MSFRNMGQEQFQQVFASEAVSQGSFPTKLTHEWQCWSNSTHTPPRQMWGRSFTPPYLLDERLLEEGDEWVGPWDVDVDLEESVGYTHQPCFSGAQ